MTFLLDTNVLSDGSKRDADPNLVAWVRNVDPTTTFISVVTLAEARSGIARMPEGRRRWKLEEWLEHDVRRFFGDRMLGIDAAIADVCGQMLAVVNPDRRAIVTMDIWIAATAVVHDLTVVTRNTRDFEALGVPLLNPWLESE